MSKCPMCGQECGEPLIAVLRDRGFDPLEDCVMLAIWKDAITKCANSHHLMCHLCKIGQSLGTWATDRGKITFTPNEGLEVKR